MQCYSFANVALSLSTVLKKVSNKLVCLLGVDTRFGKGAKCFFSSRRESQIFQETRVLLIVLTSRARSWKTSLMKTLKVHSMMNLLISMPDGRLLSQDLKTIQMRNSLMQAHLDAWVS